MIHTRNIAEETKPSGRVTLTIPPRARILIVCEKASVAGRLKTAFQEARPASENANSITESGEAAKSGQFPIDFSTPLLADESWRRLIDFAQQYELTFEIVLLTRSLSLRQWTEALQAGTFDVMEVGCDLPKAAEAPKRVLEAAYVRRFRSHPEQV